MEKFLAAFVVLLIGAAIFAAIRWWRGGLFFPRPDVVDGRPEPQSLKEMAERRREERGQ